MLDIETLGVKSNSVITQISCIPFNPNDLNMVVGLYFFQNIDFIDCVKKFDGFSYDSKTLEWWKTQSNDVKERMILNQQPIEEVLTYFKKFLTWLDDDYTFWCHIDFDLPILKNAFNVVLKEELPYHFRNRMDIRTIFKLLKFDIKQCKEEGLLKHNSFHDCLFQIKCVKKALEGKKYGFE